MQDLDHELRVLSVWPVVEVSLSVRILALRVLLLHLEMYLEHIQEVCEKELLVDVCSDIVWQLIHKSLILLGLNGVVFVILPVILKIDLKVLCHFLWKRLVVVEMSQKSKPLGEVLRVLILGSNCLEVHQDLNELTHDV